MGETYTITNTIGLLLKYRLPVIYQVETCM